MRGYDGDMFDDAWISAAERQEEARREDPGHEADLLRKGDEADDPAGWADLERTYEREHVGE